MRDKQKLMPEGQIELGEYQSRRQASRRKETDQVYVPDPRLISRNCTHVHNGPPLSDICYFRQTENGSPHINVQELGI